MFRLIQGTTYRKTLRLWTNNSNWDKLVEPKVEENSSKVIEVYEHHIKQVKALAELYDFEVYFFWQPLLLSQSRTMEEYETNIVAKQSPVRLKAEQLVYEKAKSAFSGREDEGIFFLGDVFNEVPGPVYMDWIHVGGKGNRILTDEISSRIPAFTPPEAEPAEAESR